MPIAVLVKFGVYEKNRHGEGKEPELLNIKTCMTEQRGLGQSISWRGVSNNSDDDNDDDNDNNNNNNRH
jgi:hypothetical protein